MSDNSRAYDDAECRILKAGKSESDFAFHFIGCLSGQVEPEKWKRAIECALRVMKVTA